jgi:hypothetical protein
VWIGGGLASGSSLEIGGGSRTFADIHAPGLDFQLHGSSQLVGRIIANNIELDGTARFTFDEALGTKPLESLDIDIRVHLVE